MATRAGPGWDEHVPGLLGQTVKPDQIIVVVDRVTTEEERAAFHEQWPQLDFVFNDANYGITRSVNRGLAVATGDYVFRADDDDSYRADRIEKQLALFESSGADLVFSWGEGFVAGKEAKSYLIMCPADDAGIRFALRRRNVLIHASLAFRRDRVLALGGYDETFVNAQDYALYLAAIRAGFRFAAVPEPLVRRSYNSASITVGRRYHQMMYSCAARVVHHAHSGNRPAFIWTVFNYAMLAMIPTWARRLRRRAHALIGRGA
jgi:GT2 family glycosyltransferase